MSTPGSPPLSSYQRRLFWFLGIATFFDGFDAIALSQLLPNIRREMGLLPSQEGLVVSVIAIGPVLAYLLVRQADVWGRRRVLSITIAGYTISSFLTGLMPNIAGFALCQLVAQTFLCAEFSVAAIYAAEEFPAEKRGVFIGMLQLSHILGGVACAGLTPLLIKTPLGWRSVYFVGTLPLTLMAVARSQLRETARFMQQKQLGVPVPGSFRIFGIWRSPYRNRMLLIGLISALTILCTGNCLLFWKEYALTERGFTDAAVGLCVSIAAVSAIPVLYIIGKKLDRLGRRRGAFLFYAAVILGALGAFTARTRLTVILSLILVIGVGSAIVPLLNAIAAELFPTELRADAYAWSRNVLGRAVMVVTPLFIGSCAAHLGWATTLRATIVGPLIALLLIWIALPETSRRELEDTSELRPQRPQRP
jgi:putative MFS transporter